MKVLIISDSHGNIVNLKHVLGFAKKISAGAVIHCGDWNNIDSVEAVLAFGIPVYTVLGNADIDPVIADRLRTAAKKFDEKLLEFEIDGRKIGVTHNQNHLASNIEYPDIIFCGHIHKQMESTINGTKFVNPGALANEIFFAVYDTRGNQVEFIKP